MGHCEKSITKLSGAADTLLGGCVTVLAGELQETQGISARYLFKIFLQQASSSLGKKQQVKPWRVTDSWDPSASAALHPLEGWDEQLSCSGGAAHLHWCCRAELRAEDLLPSGHAWKQPISLSPFQFSFSIQSWSEFIWSETLAFFPCVYLPVWLAQYVFHFPGSFGISLKSD